MKRGLKIKYYIRFADDFVFLDTSKAHLESILPLIEDFLRYHLGLELHERKVFMKPMATGVDFLGWVHFSSHRVPRTTTKRRMLKRIQDNPQEATIASYVGMLQHGNSFGLQSDIERIIATPPIQYISSVGQKKPPGS